MVQVVKTLGYKRGSLSYNQHRLWYIQKLLENKPVYHIPFSIEIKGILLKEALESAILQIINRHEILRCCIIEQKGVPAHKVLPLLENYSLDTLNLTAFSPQIKEIELHNALTDFYEKPFEIGLDTLFRTQLIQIEPDKFFLGVTFHHIISDALSIAVFCNELSQFYNNRIMGTPIKLPSIKISFIDYVEKEKKFESSVLKYWQGYLQNSPSISTFPTNFSRPSIPSYKGQTISFDLSDALLSELKTLSHQNNVTLFTTLLAAFMLLLYRYTQQEDLVVGLPIANRSDPDLEPLIGFFTNTLPFRINKFGSGMAFQDLLILVQETYIEILENQDVPLQKIIDEIKLPQDISLNPLFQVMFSYQETLGHDLKLKGAVSALIPPKFPYSKFDLTFFCEIESRQIKIEFATDIYDEDIIKCLGTHYLTLLKAVVKEPHSQLSELELLSEDEKSTILCDWNKTEHTYPGKKFLHHYFEEQAKLAPHAVAVKFGPDEITYEQLNQKANCLAHTLIEKDIKKGTNVAIGLERSIETLIAILGIIKAGGSYVPLDLSYPQERISFMLEDSSSQFVVTREEHTHYFSKNNISVVIIDKITCLEDTNPNITIKSTDIIYTIYTSGSTGQPKGSPNTHVALVNRILWMRDQCKITSKDIFLQKTPLTFDVSGWEFFLPLVTGSKLIVIPPEEHKDVQHILNIVREEKITIIHFIPSMLDLFLEWCEGGANSLALRIVCTSGETLLPQIANKFFTILPNSQLLNLYGPTEAAIDVTFIFYKPEYCRYQSSLIGKPIANTQIYILDKNLGPVPVNTKGEIYIGGVCLSPGYINRESLNKEKFIKNPFHSKMQNGGFNPSKVLFKTGDIGKFFPDGNIQFLGRADNQVKILGVRVELSEIESVLSESSLIKHAVVRYTSSLNESHSLKAYIVLINHNPHPEEEKKAIEAYLREKLPVHMHPHDYFFLEKFPLLPSGKVNSQALDNIGIEEKFKSQNSSSPKTTLQKKVATIWCKVLNIKEAILGDTFFALGGNSLLAVQAVAHINEEFHTKLTLKDFLECRTLERLCYHLEKLPQSSFSEPIHIKTNEFISSLTPHQKSLWIQNTLNPTSSSYNISGTFNIDGKININVLEKALTLLIERHELLRANFILSHDEPIQAVNPQTNFSLEIVDIKESDPELREKITKNHIKEEAIKPFNLENGPLFRAKLLRHSESTSVLILTIHHIICDEFSLNILCRDLSELYNSLKTNRPLNLPRQDFQFSDFARIKNKEMLDKKITSQLDFWKEKLSNYHEPLNLPLDHPRMAKLERMAGFSEKAFCVPGINQTIKKIDSSLFQFLLVAVNVLLYLYSRQNKFAVGIPYTSRDYPGTKDLVGYFVKVLAFPASINPNVTFLDLLKQTQILLIDLYNNSDVSFNDIVKRMEIKNNTAYNPIFQVMFTQKMANKAILAFDGLKIRSHINIFHSQFDMGISVFDNDHDQVGITIEYANNLLGEETINNFIKNYESIINQAIENPHRLIHEFSLSLRLVNYKPGSSSNSKEHFSFFPPDKCLQDVFAEQVNKTPEGIALRFNDETLTYAGLNQKANRLAHYLIQKGIKPETPVAIGFERSFEMIISVMAVLKAGGAYVPLDPSLPLNRLSFMLEDTKAPFILAPEASIFHENYKDKIINPLTIIENKDLPITNPDVACTPHNLAYIIYTSGSTGRPKGVMIEHEGVVCLMYSLQDRYPLEYQETVLLQSPFYFDASVEEIFWPLLFGGTTVIAPPNIHRDLHQLIAIIQNHKIQNLRFVPSLLDILVTLPEFQSCSSIKRIFSGGEALQVKTLQSVLNALPGIDLYNDYGPTEATVRATSYRCIVPGNNLRVSIGQPIANKNIYILDEKMKVVPNGTQGELYIGGIGIARGYLNLPELTKECFINNPCQLHEIKNTRLYKTGDLARVLPDGNIDFLGRLDEQIKIRGNRIELGEIENCLRKHFSIKQAIVHAFSKDQQQILVAYIVKNSDIEANKLYPELQAFLKEELPEYMLPLAYVTLESFPLLANGKVDKQNLPKPQREDFVSISSELPQTPTEEILSKLWNDLLKLDSIGRRDNFFEIGGHSLLVVQMIIQLKKKGIILNPGDVFEFPTLYELGLHIDNLTVEEKANEAA